VVATDPNSAKDFTLFCQQTGHVLMNLEEKGNETRIWIKKKPL
jgi:TusA-related sulfurtransferase